MVDHRFVPNSIRNGTEVQIGEIPGDVLTGWAGGWGNGILEMETELDVANHRLVYGTGQAWLGMDCKELKNDDGPDQRANQIFHDDGV